MTSQANLVLGILELDEGLMPDSPVNVQGEGALQNPETFNVPIITELVEGAWADIVIRGDPSLKGPCVAAARRLVARGANVISADCGFFIRHQAAVSGAVNVPVAMSSLLLIPTLLRQLSPAQKLAVITADSRHCSEDLFGIENPADRARVVVGGIEGGKYVSDALSRPLVLTSIDQIEQEVCACVAQLRARYPEIGMLLFECTGFPCVTNTLRRRTGLPIYDITDLCRLTLA
ncbi:hypothetical protein, partial [Mesorhizobium sp. M0684]|uniref:hypothetical protein n=1 Tax=Mesorhizobium sp. M0684 TaxID=2956986 RepID=UPI003335D8CC